MSYEVIHRLIKKSPRLNLRGTICCFSLGLYMAASNTSLPEVEAGKKTKQNVWIYEGQAEYQWQEIWKDHINKIHVPQTLKTPPPSLHVLVIHTAS